MEFHRAARLGALLSRDYSERFFRLLATYRDTSASEAASRLGLHIRTAQEFLEGLVDLGCAAKEEVREGTRPYFRYNLTVRRLALEVDLDALADPLPSSGADGKRIRERADAPVRFTTARGGDRLTSVTLWTAGGRSGEARRISLSQAQGRFLFHLPFPNAEPLSVKAIMAKAEVPPDQAPEVHDIVALLAGHGVIEEA